MEAYGESFLSKSFVFFSSFFLDRYIFYFDMKRPVRICIFYWKILRFEENRIFFSKFQCVCGSSVMKIFFSCFFLNSRLFIEIDTVSDSLLNIESKSIWFNEKDWTIVEIGSFFSKSQLSHIEKLFFFQFFKNSCVFIEILTVPDSVWRDESEYVWFN